MTATPTRTTTEPVTAPVFGDLDRRAVAVARALAMDAVETAGSGHPGTAMALAPVAHLLFQRHIRHDPADAGWEGRDRFVLSCGHASILQYTQLYLTGYGLGLEDLRRFRQLGSLTPGHPELGHTTGVETTTGPLGQGVATAVGMAMALKRDEGRLTGGGAVARDVVAPAGIPTEAPTGDLAEVPARTVWVLCSDGDLQEGISYEAGALAGRHRLDNLVVVWDDNSIQIEGSTDLTTREDTAARFAAQGWFVQTVGLAADGDIDTDALDGALSTAHAHGGRPSLIVLKSRIAWPAPNATNTPASHGAPLGAAEVAATKALLGVADEPFTVPADVVEHTRAALGRGAGLHRAWDKALAEWAQVHPGLAAARDRAIRPLDPAEAADALPVFEPGTAVAPRDASGEVIQALAERLPRLWGGSADLGDSNRTTIGSGGSFLPADEDDVDGDGERGSGGHGVGGHGLSGRNIHWGVREHAMAAALNGIAIVGYDTPFAGTFLVFSDYERPSLRLASLMRLPVVHVWTHDSVALGADGPTHQPVEHLASLRAMPGLSVVRPADAAETAAAWLTALGRPGPVGLVLARQALPVLPTPVDAVREGVARGAYVVAGADEADGAVDVVLLASGSEVSLALGAREALAGRGITARVVSVPCKDWFAEQDAAYRDAVLPPAVRARVVVEAASVFGWHDLLGDAGRAVTIDGFGTSASASDAMTAMGMTEEAVVAAALESLDVAGSR
ncbi:transketolase family protein [Streptomyces scopuliridis]|uniref:transketolase family protein n=1 Tax=Streptomyces scopuliridis TaxID=452529 RepID=UPI0036A09C9F